MKKYAVTLLLAFITSTVAYAQIPDLQYNNYKYQDSTNFDRPHKHGKKLQPKGVIRSRTIQL